ncbi:MAG: hypothetical protein LZ167_07445 [Thaumarchaeota archaeon]|nr:hypothetical protein [Candidatus Geocrenenecus arthurdayi]
MLGILLKAEVLFRGVRAVEVGLEELEQYLRKNCLDVGDLLEALMDMRKFRDLVWYYVHDCRKIVVLDVSDKYR